MGRDNILKKKHLVSVLLALLGMILNVESIPGVDEPLVGHLFAGKVARVHDFLGELLTLLLELVVQDKDADLGLGNLLALGTELLGLELEILGELADSVSESAAGVVDLIDNEDVAADEGGLGRVKVEPLGLDDLGFGGDGGLVVLVVSLPDLEVLVEGEADGLDGDVLVVLLLEEGSLHKMEEDDVEGKWEEYVSESSK